MSRRRKEHAEEEHENHERWLVTYADMLTLLMVLFIVMFSISQVDSKKFLALHDGLAESFRNGNPAIDGGDGLLTATRAASAPSVDMDTAAKAVTIVKQQATLQAQDRSELSKARQQLEGALGKAGLSAMTRFRLDARGLTVSIVTDDVMFPLGSADLQPRGRAVLDTVAPIVRRMPNAVAVEGHTDDLPISGRFASNWELSAERATTVLRYLLQRHHVPARRLSAAGYADQRPLAPNRSGVARQRNRRVEIVLLSRAGTPDLTSIVPNLAPSASGAHHG